MHKMPITPSHCWESSNVVGIHHTSHAHGRGVAGMMSKGGYGTIEGYLEVNRVIFKILLFFCQVRQPNSTRIIRTTWCIFLITWCCLNNLYCQLIFAVKSPNAWICSEHVCQKLESLRSFTMLISEVSVEFTSGRNGCHCHHVIFYEGKWLFKFLVHIGNYVVS